LANLCANPRPGTADQQGSLAQEKAYLRSFIHETYLWYQDVPDPAAANYASAQDYFAALKTPAKTPSGTPVDQFHFWEYTADWNAASSGLATDYGIKWLFLANSVPRKLVVGKVAPGSPAALAGVKRGDQVSAIDGVDLIYDDTDAGIAKLNAGLQSSAGMPHQFAFNNAAAISLTKTPYAYSTVQDVQTFQNGGQTIGYFRFDSHIANSEGELVSAIEQLQAAHVADLVIDMRYNGGGLLSIASKLAYMVAGPAATSAKVFERLVYNDKLSAENFSVPFYAFGYNNQALPHLDLARVILLVTFDTASASESVINSLRGAGVQVDLIGQSTRGKPYGFVPQDNCGVTYFAIQFKGVNNLGFGDYTDGFAPTCSATDDYTHALGDTAETMLRTALSYRQTGFCPAVASAAGASASAFASPSARAFQAARPAAASRPLLYPDNPALRILTDMARP
jgi:hypothetical protein